MRSITICTNYQVFLGRSKREEICGVFGTYREENVHVYGHRVLIGKPEGKVPLGRPRHGWQVI
jgi:hypothetical protein